MFRSPNTKTYNFLVNFYVAFYAREFVLSSEQWAGNLFEQTKNYALCVINEIHIQMYNESSELGEPWSHGYLKAFVNFMYGSLNSFSFHHRSQFYEFKNEKKKKICHTDSRHWMKFEQWNDTTITFIEDFVPNKSNWLSWTMNYYDIDLFEAKEVNVNRELFPHFFLFFSFSFFDK